MITIPIKVTCDKPNCDTDCLDLTVGMQLHEFVKPTFGYFRLPDGWGRVWNSAKYEDQVLCPKHYQELREENQRLYEQDLQQRLTERRKQAEEEAKAKEQAERSEFERLKSKYG